MKYALDPVLFARDILKISADEWQATVLRSGSKRLLLNCSRQSGKSSTAAILALHTAIYYHDSLVLLVSPSLRQSQELFKKVQGYYKLIPNRQKLPEDNKLSMMLANGSRIISLPGTEGTIRGFSAVSLLIEDEASRVDDSLYYSVRPMLAVSAGRIVLMSTPWGKRGHFFEEWTGSGDWDRVEIMATMCPRISPEFLAEEKRALGDWWYQQEYMCKFSETTDSLFSYDTIMAAMSDDVKPLFSIPVSWTDDTIQPLEAE